MKSYKTNTLLDYVRNAINNSSEDNERVRDAGYSVLSYLILTILKDKVSIPRELQPFVDIIVNYKNLKSS